MKKLMLAVVVSAALGACSQDAVEPEATEQKTAAPAAAEKKSAALDMAEINAERDASNAEFEAAMKRPANISPEAKQVLDRMEQALAGVRSIDATLVGIKDSEMYGYEQFYQGRIIFDFGGKVGSRENVWYEGKQEAKGRTKHIRGVRNADGFRELHLLKEKVVTGGANASPGVQIATALSTPYSNTRFASRTEMGMGGDTVVLAAQKEVSGTLCNVIEITQSGASGRATRYYYGVDDGLPYGREVEVTTEDGHQLVVIKVVSMTVNPPLAADQFELDVPEHFAVERFVAAKNKIAMGTGVTAPEWTLLGSDDKEHSLSDYRGQLVLLDFWATWCGPCKAKMPHIQELHAEFKDKGLKVISVLSMDEGHEEEAVEYLEEHGYTFDMVYGNEKLTEDYKIRYLPTVLLIDAEGTVIHHRDDPGINEGINEEVELHDAISGYFEQ